MHTDVPRGPEALAIMLLLGACVAMVSTGFAHGWWWPNVHNGLLSLAFAVAGGWTLLIRSWNREGLLLGAVAVVEGVMFLGRQIGHADPASAWWAWLGVWPVGLLIGLITWFVLCFPEGRFLSPGWRWFGWAALSVAAACSLISALWPVEYDTVGIRAPHPLNLAGDMGADRVWSAIAHPAYAIFQISWAVAVVHRWRQSNGAARRQIGVVGAAAAASALLLLTGLAIWGTPRAGLLASVSVPLAAWWALDRLSAGRVIEETRARDHLDALTPRENDVLDLMAQGLSNQAIADRLHLSIKTIEPAVSTIFTKLNLPTDSESNRRVLAVIRYLQE